EHGPHFRRLAVARQREQLGDVGIGHCGAFPRQPCPRTLAAGSGRRKPGRRRWPPPGYAPGSEETMQTARHDDVLIIGGGHNGLVCAAYLAAAGLKVRVLERRHLVGGAAVTEEFHPGFRNSTASYTVSLLNPKVIRDLRLHAHGLRVVERPFANFL